MKKRKVTQKSNEPLNVRNLEGFFTILRQILKFRRENDKIKKIIIPALIATAILATVPVAASYVNSLMWNSIQIASGKKRR